MEIDCCVIEIFENEEEYERNRGSMYHEDGLTKPTMVWWVAECNYAVLLECIEEFECC